MGSEAKVKVRLDLSGARADLASLYRDMGNSPGVAVAPGGVGGGGGAAMGGAAGGGGFGGMGLGRLFGLGAGLLGAGALLRGSIRDAGDIGGALTEGISETISRTLFGTVGAQARGGNRALEMVKEQVGLAVGLSGDPEAAARQFQPLFDTIRNVETAREVGKQAIGGAFSGQIAEEALGGLVGRLVAAMEGLIRAFEKSPREWLGLG